jgi:hypothetical protein
MNGLQCLKYLWISLNQPKLLAGPDAATQHVFDQGHLVGELAKRVFPDGINVPPDDFMGNIRQTRELMKKRRTIFEAGITTGRLYSRLDILKPAGEDAWDIVEVKSSTKVKDVDIEDVAFQRYCCRLGGVEIRNCFLMHIDNTYVRHGEIKPDKLFIIEDITEQVAETARTVPDKVAAMLEAIEKKECPEVPIGRQCDNPYECLVEGCKEFLPEDNVLELYRGGQRAYELINDGIFAICEIPDDFKLSGIQEIQRSCISSGQPHVDPAQIQGFLDSLKYPHYYFDFETFSAAVPPFDGTRPYQNIPFQFSLHVVKDPRAKPEHFSYLASGMADPRPGLLIVLKKWLGRSGSIIVYNQAFEKRVLEELAEAFPEYADWVKGVTSRFVDLLIPFRNFWYYHPAQRGSASLKYVMPALTGRGYEGLGIANGEIASLEFYRVTYTDVPEAERRRVRRDLETYCGQDTEGMIWIINALGELT